MPDSISSQGGDGGVTPRPMFNDAQRSELVDIITAVMRAQQQQPPLQPPEGGANPNPQPLPNEIGLGSTFNEWNAEQIGYFDPNYKGSGPVVNAGKHVFYRDVYVFIDRCKDMAPIRGEDKLRTVLPQCFRGASLIWHSAELSELEKGLLRTASLAS